MYRHLLSVSPITLCPRSPGTWRPKGLTDHGPLPRQRAGSALLVGRPCLSLGCSSLVRAVRGHTRWPSSRGDRRIYKHRDLQGRRLSLTRIKGADGGNVEATKTLG